MNEPFSIRRAGTTIYDILDPDGMVIGWGADKRWASAMALGLSLLTLMSMRAYRSDYAND